jgi:hypothetical protein
MRHTLLVALLAGLSWSAIAAGPPSSFHDRVVALYSFSPHTLKQPEIEAKSQELDQFWSSVKASGPTDLAALRQELARQDSSPFFSYDGAKLLLSLSKTKEDQALALSAMSRTDLADLQWDDYFRTIHYFAVNELDTTDAAFKILGNNKFKVFIPQHALTLDQEMCLLFLLLPTKESFYFERVKDRLFKEKDVTAQKSLLTLLGYTVTKSGDEAIARFAGAPDQPTESREYAKMIMKATKEMESSALLGLSMSSYGSLREEQRKLFARVSDEALIEWERLRIKIRQKGPQ